MILKKIKPRTTSQRNLIKINYNNVISKKPLLKYKIIGTKTSSGRNNTGKITISHKGGGHKKRYRKVEFMREKSKIEIITSIEYDPNRNSFIASSYDFISKSYQYILSPKNLKVGDIIKSGFIAEIKVGHSLPISKIPVGSLIHNISKTRMKKAQISRSAGSFSRLIEKTSKYGRILLNSGKQKLIPIKCFATLGIVSNDFVILATRAKAGRSRWLNQRPTVRGVAMNPIDHPHGGGEGKTSGGRSSVTPWGKPTRGIKTSRSKNKLTLIK
jgi:large subunit ribosomal protein L2